MGTTARDIILILILIHILILILILKFLTLLLILLTIPDPGPTPSILSHSTQNHALGQKPCPCSFFHFLPSSGFFLLPDPAPFSLLLPDLAPSCSLLRILLLLVCSFLICLLRHFFVLWYWIDVSPAMVKIFFSKEIVDGN